MVFEKFRVGDITSVSVDKSNLEGYAVDICVHYKNTKRVTGLGMTLENAKEFRNELDALIKEAEHEEIL